MKFSLIAGAAAVVAAPVLGALRGAPSTEGVDAVASTYDQTTAVDHVYRAGVAYCNADLLEKWDCGDACSNHPVSAPVYTMTNATDYTQAYVTRLPDGTPYMSFRGTVGNSLIDWIVDDGNIFFVSPFPACPDCKVHHGFYNAYMGLRPQILEAFLELNVTKEEKIQATGHSLGAAMAVMALTDMHMNGYTLGTSYTYGTPRVGNDAFQAYWESNLGPDALYRVVHWKDIVAQIPFEWMGYRHVPREIWYTEDSSSYTTCNGSGEDPSCSDSTVSLSASDHLLYLNVTLTSLCARDQ